jgi:hypothetical protein
VRVRSLPSLDEAISAATGDYIVLLGREREFEGAEIESFIAELNRGVDFVKGSRFVGSSPVRCISRFQQTTEVAANRIASYIFRAEITDMRFRDSAFRANLAEFLDLDRGSFDLPTTLSFRAAKAHLRMSEVRVDERPGTRPVQTFRFVANGSQTMWAIVTEWLRRPSLVRRRGPRRISALSPAIREA